MFSPRLLILLCIVIWGDWSSDKYSVVDEASRKRCAYAPCPTIDSILVTKRCNVSYSKLHFGEIPAASQTPRLSACGCQTSTIAFFSVEIVYCLNATPASSSSLRILDDWYVALSVGIARNLVAKIRATIQCTFSRAIQCNLLIPYRILMPWRDRQLRSEINRASSAKHQRFLGHSGPCKQTRTPPSDNGILRKGRMKSQELMMSLMACLRLFTWWSYGGLSMTRLI